LIDSLEKQALSCTFAVRNGTVQYLKIADEAGPDGQPLTAGTVVDAKYQVSEMIGEGGMGAVFKVHHLLLKKDMALKTFRSHAVSSEVWQRFQREAQAIARLKHQNIVAVYDFGIAGGTVPYYTMELLEGESLASHLHTSGPLEPSRALVLFKQAAEAMAHAHRQQIVHRDLKPGNLFLQRPLTKSGEYQVKVVDFGIAKLAEDSSASGQSVSLEAQSLTQDGTIFGTPLYMSPEQSLGLDVDSRSDIYSFGCVLYECLVGKPPFVCDTALATIMAHQTEVPQKLSGVLADQLVPQRLDGLISRLLAKKPEKRYQTFEEVVSDLDFCIEDLSRGRKFENAGVQPAAAKWVEEDNSESNPHVRNKAIYFVGVLLLAAALAGWIYLGLIVAPSPHHRSDTPPAAATMSVEQSFIHTDFDDHFTTVREKEGRITTPYLSKDDSTGRTFRFPYYASIGSLQDLVTGEMRDCVGRVHIKPNRQLLFHPNLQVLLCPALLDRFGADDLRGLQFDRTDSDEKDWSIEQLRHLPRLKGLERLSVGGCRFIGASAIPMISQLPKLDDLDASGSALDGEVLTHLTGLPQLKSLRLDRTKGAEKLFQFMARSPGKYRLSVLIAPDCRLKDEDLKYIARIHSIRYMELSRNDIKGSGFAYLAEMPRLKALLLDQSSFAPGAAEQLAKIKTLKKVTVARGTFSPADMRLLAHELGANTVEEIETKSQDQ
jgi:serine/threonine-protein kinase